jgi:hypothetical protein
MGKYPSKRKLSLEKLTERAKDHREVVVNEAVVMLKDRIEGFK